MSRTSISNSASITALAIAGLALARWNLPQTSRTAGILGGAGSERVEQRARRPTLAEVSAMTASICSSVAPHEMSESVRNRGVEP